MKTIQKFVHHYMKLTYQRHTAFPICILLFVFFVVVNLNKHLHIGGHNRNDGTRIGQSTKFTVINMINKIVGRKDFSLSSVPWENRTSVSKSPIQRHHQFRLIISTEEHTRLLEIFRVFRTICDWSNLTYFLYGGSLLGSYRHHGLVPWDDDIDVLMNESEKLQIYTHFTNIPRYALCTPRNKQWKLYQSDDKTKRHCSEIMWPYVDIFFFSENDTHIWDNNEMYQFVYNFEKEDIFPLTTSIFEGDLVMVPRNTHNVLQKSYDVNLCVSALYSHKNESVREQKIVSLPCKRLLPYFPFVLRSCENGIIWEYMVDKSVTLYKIVTDHKCDYNTP